MNVKSGLMVGVCLAAATLAPIAGAQQCTSGPDAAVECFVGNAVRTNLVSLQYGMTISQFKEYGVSVSHIVQAQPTSVALVGLASAVADALPPGNADGSFQRDRSVHRDEFNRGLWNREQFSHPARGNQFAGSEMVFARPCAGDECKQRHTPLAWKHVAHDRFLCCHILKLPAGITTAQAVQFAQSLAQVTYTYRTSTGRTSL